MFRKKTVIFLGLLVSSIFFFTIYVLLTVLPGQENEIKTVSSIEKAIYNELNKLPEVYHTSGANSDNTKFYTFFNMSKFQKSVFILIKQYKFKLLMLA